MPFVCWPEELKKMSKLTILNPDNATWQNVAPKQTEQAKTLPHNDAWRYLLAKAEFLLYHCYIYDILNIKFYTYYDAEKNKKSRKSGKSKMEMCMFRKEHADGW